METLKDFEGLFSPDPRYSIMMTASYGDKVVRAYTFEQHYRRFAVLGSPRHAPEEIVNGFISAQHLAIYAWFVFPFSVVANLQALLTLEHALRRRAGNKPASGLKERLCYAVTRGWLRGQDLRALSPCIDPEELSSFADRPLDSDGKRTLETLIDNLPDHRNMLAHGNWFSGDDSFMNLDVVLQLVNQLYNGP